MLEMLRRILAELRKKYDEQSVSGTTTDMFVVVLDWDTRGLVNKSIFIKNTGDANAMRVKVSRYANYNGDIEYIEDERELLAGELIDYQLNAASARIKVSVKSSSAGNSTTYDIEAIGNVW